MYIENQTKIPIIKLYFYKCQAPFYLKVAMDCFKNNLCTKNKKLTYFETCHTTDPKDTFQNLLDRFAIHIRNNYYIADTYALAIRPIGAFKFEPVDQKDEMIGVVLQCMSADIISKIVDFSIIYNDKEDIHATS